MKKEYSNKFCIEALKFTLNNLKEGKNTFNNLNWCIDCISWLQKFKKISQQDFNKYSEIIFDLQN